MDALRAHVEGLGLELMEISAAAHQGTRELVLRAAQLLQELPPVTVYEPTYVERPPEVDTAGEVDIQEFDGTWVVDAPWLQRLIANVNFGDYESRNWFERLKLVSHSPAHPPFLLLAEAVKQGRPGLTIE